MPVLVRGAGASQVTARAFSTTVSDVVSKVTFVNYKGERHTLAGFHGQSLVEVCAYHGKPDLLEDDGAGGGNTSEIVHSDTWTESVYGEGATSAHSHVVIPPEWMGKIPAPTSNEAAILEASEDMGENSRLGAEIRLSKELDGLVVYIPDPYPCDIP